MPNDAIAPETVEQTPAPVPAPEAATPPAEPETPETPEASTEAPAEASKAEEAPTQPTEPKEAPEGQTEPSDDLMYNGYKVTVSIPDDINTELTGKGLDAQALVNELYTSENFTLSDETRAKVDAIYGKAVVDSYLAGLRAQNDTNFRNYEQSQKDAQEAADQAWTETQEVIGGGEEVWDAMSDWADGAMTEQQRADWDMIMEGDNVMMQQLAIKELHGRWVEAGGGVDGEGNVHPAQAAPSSMTGQSNESLELVDLDGGGGNASAGGAISAAEFTAAFRSGEYFKDPEGWDARRNLGITKGL